MGGMKMWITCMAVALMVIGCASKGTYQVSVQNDSNRPVTLWLTKDGPPAEDGWRTPEELVAMPSDQRKYDLAFVPPGRTGYTGKVSGRFPEGTNAVLRVYEGEKEIFDLAKASPTTRTDYVLKPGSNNLIVTERAGRIVVEPN